MNASKKQTALVARINAQPGPKMLRSLHTFDSMLRNHAIGLMTAFGVFQYDSDANTLTKSLQASDIKREPQTKCQIIPLWLSFSTGIECLAKSVLIKHGVLRIKKKEKTEKQSQLRKNASNYEAAIQAYVFINALYIDYTGPSLTPFEEHCVEKEILHLYNLNIGTLGDVINHLGTLREKGVIDDDQTGCLANALQVLSDIRRNIDAHTFYGITVGGSINGDLDELYLPAVNLLLRL